MKKQTVILGILVSMLFIGCQQNPDSSIAVNKDMDKLIEQAEKSENGMKSLSGNYEVYQTSFGDDALKVFVDVDADILIPEVEQMPIFRVQQEKFSQEFLNKAVHLLMGDGEIYDGSALGIRSKSEILEEMKYIKQELESLDEADENRDILKEEYEQELQRLQTEYEHAPDSLILKGNESDGLLYSTKEMTERHPYNEFYNWVYSLNPDGEIFYGIKDVENGAYASMTIQNSSEIGNYLRFRKSRHGYVFTSAYMTTCVGTQGTGNDFWKVGEQEPKDVNGQAVEYTDELTTISESEAVKIADELIEKMGLSEIFKYDEGCLYNEILDIRHGELAEAFGYRKEWILRYSRKIDNVFVTFNSIAKSEEGWVGNEYMKYSWPPEVVEIRVTDDGIVGVDYNAPLEIMETVVENTGLKSFDEIRTIFEKMIVVTNAEDDTMEESFGTQIKVNQVILGYARISEVNSYQTGLLVPAWDFIGTKIDSYGSQTTGSLLTINAIDGSVIDRSVGY